MNTRKLAKLVVTVKDMVTDFEVSIEEENMNENRRIGAINQFQNT